MKISKKLQPWGGKIFGISAGAIALGLIGLGISKLTAPSPAQMKQAKADSVTQLPQRVEVVALGRLEPKGEMIRVGGSREERIGRLEISEGDIVKAGAVLAYLESYEERLAERNYAASQLIEAKERLKATTTYAQAQIQEAQTKIQQVDQPRTFELEAQQATVRQLKAELALAQEDLQRSQSLYKEGAISQQSRDREVSNTRQLQEKVNNATASLIRLQTTLKTNLVNAQAELRSQQANLPLTQIQVALESAQQNLNLAEARLRRTIIRAPKTGRILRIQTHPGEVIGDNGILEMGDTSQMYAVAEVYESDAGLVKVDQPATIISRNRAFSKPLTGKVAEIGWQIFKNNILNDDPAANADARVVEVKIRLDDGKAVEAFTNLQVDVRINLR
ncbi:MAG: ABC exporter membrane fusion protein [Desmonostoc geniculatum HA4340-LM1]|jgi:HlyD family secretion protein|nr:ABC exporter membrane fusion protein [Desmonostoc geniculatum HA4340-LM1]